MKNAGSVVAMVLGCAGMLALVASPAFADGKPAAKAPTARKPPKAKAAKVPAPSDHCAIDDLGFDSMLAKKTDAPPAAPVKKPKVDSMAQAKAAAETFDLRRKDRDSTAPRGDSDMQMKATTLSTSAVGAVVAKRLPDLEYCMMKIPEAERGTEEFMLHLTIAPKGTVTAATVDGGPNASKIEACVQAQVKRWPFPQTDAPSVVDYPLSFKVAH